MGLTNYYTDEAVIGIENPELRDTCEYTVSVEAPGTLKETIPTDALKKTTKLKIIGNINSTDLRTLRELTGSDSIGNFSNGHVSELDLTESNIVSGGEPFFITKEHKYDTDDNQLPPYAFYRCWSLHKVYLPKSVISCGNNAFGCTENLDTISAPNCLINIHNGIYNKDSTELIKVLPNTNGIFKVNRNVRIIDDGAFIGCDSISSVYLYPNVEYIGNEAFKDMTFLSQIKICRITPPLLGNDVFNLLNKNCQLFVLPRTREDYLNQWQWKNQSMDKIRTWGIAVYFNNKYTIDGYHIYSRYYGESNDQINFSSSLSICKGEGVPDSVISLVRMVNNTTPNSPVGTYNIDIIRDYPNYEEYPLDATKSNIKLEIEKNTAKIICDTCYVAPGASVSTLTYHLEGLQNGETEIPDKDWFDKPYLVAKSLTGNKWVFNKFGNEIGKEYEILVYNQPSSRNYEFVVKPGLVIITDKTSTSLKGVNYKKEIDNKYYNISGEEVPPNYKGLVIVNRRKIIKR